MPGNERPTVPPSSGSTDDYQPVLILTKRKPELLPALWACGELALPLNISKNSLDISALMDLCIQFAGQQEMKTTVWGQLLVDLE